MSDLDRHVSADDNGGVVQSATLMLSWKQQQHRAASDDDDNAAVAFTTAPRLRLDGPPSSYKSVTFTATAAGTSLVTLERPRNPLSTLFAHVQDAIAPHRRTDIDMNTTIATTPDDDDDDDDDDKPSSQPRSYNTAHLPYRLLSDLAAAGTAGLAVSPLISMIDRAIMENASGRAPSLLASLSHSLRSLLARPHRFLLALPHRLVFALYTGTYAAANLLDTAASTLAAARAGAPAPRADAVTHGPAKFAATSAANLSLCLYKDARFTRLFGPAAAPAHPVPRATYALFAARDALTVFASFNVPPMLAPLLPPLGTGPEAQRWLSRASVAQFVAPAAVQVLSTPLHLLGLDLYNRPGGSWRRPGAVVAGGRGASARCQEQQGRAARVRRDWAKSCVARVCRIVPAFGVGGVVNTGVRARLLGGLDEEEEEEEEEAAW